MEGAAVSIAKKSHICIAALVLLAGSAQATDICVKCTGPDASYDCVVNGSASADTVTKLYCITALAKVGPHASCAIDRASVSPCQGERREFTIPAGVEGPFGGPSEQNANAGAPVLPPNGAPTNGVPQISGQEPADEQAPAQAASDGPPKTVQEMVEKSPVSASLNETQKSAGDAAKSAGTALEKASSAVGSAAKTSWKCLSSFFSNC